MGPLKSQEKGFSLIEILIALTIFAIFATAFLTGQNAQVSDSMMMQKEMLLHQLAEKKLQMILLSPPALEESLTLTPKTGNFTDDGYPDIEFSIEFKRMTLPSYQVFFSAPAPQEEDNASSEESDPAPDQKQEAYTKKIYEIMKKNMEEMVWQIKVTVKEKETEFPYQLTTLINNEKAQINMNL
jgi:prepilin-type N-terminal cleavage/methylation domain-containing protein